MSKLSRTVAVTAIAAIAVAVPVTFASTASAEGTAKADVPCEEWYIDDDGSSLWNNCDSQQRRQEVDVTDTQNGTTPMCLKPGVNVLAEGEVGTGYIRAVNWDGAYCD